MRKTKRKLIAKVLFDLKVLKLLDYKFRMAKVEVRREALNKMFGNGPGDLQGLDGLL
jgi:hypothetical protein